MHDHEISDWVFGDDIICVLDRGFDVFADNPMNDTGRHKHTGNAAVVLKNAEFVSGELSQNENETRTIKKEDLSALELDVLDFVRLPDSVEFACDAFENGRLEFCKLEFSCSDVIYCWNEFTDDAWFQE
ncbi:MAG: hypothetical protein K2J80_12335 [Oscillospiraceae bacterium]|nr:hypothetical protein [Oscillospiraceae bacterium]